MGSRPNMIFVEGLQLWVPAGAKNVFLYQVIKENIDKDKKENQKNYLTQREIQFFKLTNRHFYDLERQITKTMESVKEERFCEANKNHIFKKMEEDKPGYGLLTEGHKKNYMRNVENFLKKKFKDGAFYTKYKLKDMILEHFLNLTFPNSEYDLLLFLKVCV